MPVVPRFRVTHVPNLMAHAHFYDKKLDKVLGAAAAAVESEAKRRAPVDTGRLRSSIRHSKESDKRWLVTVGVSYGKFPEYGTRYQKAQPYLRPAVRAVNERLDVLFGLV